MGASQPALGVSDPSPAGLKRVLLLPAWLAVGLEQPLASQGCSGPIPTGGLIRSNLCSALLLCT